MKAIKIGVDNSVTEVEVRTDELEQVIEVLRLTDRFDTLPAPALAIGADAFDITSPRNEYATRLVIPLVYRNKNSVMGDAYVVGTFDMQTATDLPEIVTVSAIKDLIQMFEDH